MFVAHERGKEHSQLETQPTHSILMWHDTMSQLEREWPCKWVMKWKWTLEDLFTLILLNIPLSRLMCSSGTCSHPHAFHFKFTPHKEFLLIVRYAMFTVHYKIRCGIFLAHSQGKILFWYLKTFEEIIFPHQTYHRTITL